MEMAAELDHLNCRISLNIGIISKICALLTCVLWWYKTSIYPHFPMIFGLRLFYLLPRFLFRAILVHFNSCVSEFIFISKKIFPGY